ncbi:hypothetical protein Ciccas_010269, partial [Cichlidogyrus casuarinus]
MGGQPSKHRLRKPLRFDTTWNYQPESDRSSTFFTTVSSVKNPQEGQFYIALYQWPNDPQYFSDTQISILKGDKLIYFGKSVDNDWTDVQCLRTGERGWVPSNYIKQLPSSFAHVPSTFKKAQNDLSVEKWYHGAIERSYAEFMLNSGITGSFLVRDSEGSPGNYTISVRNKENISHFRIASQNNRQFYITEKKKFPSVKALIRHLERNLDVLPCLLQYPVAKEEEGANVLDFADCWQIDRKEIIMKHKLGSGQYGVVYEALWTKHNVTVAVKTVKEEVTVREEFLEEARLMKNLKHPNLVQLLGLCTREPPYYIITEFMCNGNLLDYLRNQPRELLPPSVLLQMATSVAKGMAYLEERNFIHRDLAARNCLVAQINVVKVADFGLARCMERDDTYQAKEGTKFPIKWTAPEGLVYNRFSIKSDVWAFGVLLWEIATYGKTPYPGVELCDVYPLLEKGTRMDPPQGCPKDINDIMQKCWHWEPEMRPSFKTILKQLEQIIDIGDEVARELELLQKSAAAIDLNDGPIQPLNLED